MEKYEWPRKKAQDFANFLIPMLEFDPNKRATAVQSLAHPWLITNAPEEQQEDDDDEEGAAVVVQQDIPADS